jgi:hypothetical protein
MVFVECILLVAMADIMLLVRIKGFTNANVCDNAYF